jgi:tellurite methyltransferase
VTPQERQRWEQVYQARSKDGYPPPDPLLFEFTPPVLESGEHPALDLASGLGQNGLWLAEQGYTVDLMDISRTALMRAQDEMGNRRLRTVNLFQVDLDRPDLKLDYYEIVCVFRFLKRDLFPMLRASIAPGGRLIYETFNRGYLEAAPNFNPLYLLEPGELASHFSDWNILHNTEGKYTSRLVAARPG